MKSGPKKLGKGAGLTLQQVVEQQDRWARGGNVGRRAERQALTVGGEVS